MSNAVQVTVYAAAPPVFRAALSGAEYDAGDSAAPLDGTADAARGSVSYQWLRVGADGAEEEIPGAVNPVYTPGTAGASDWLYFVRAVNAVGTSRARSESGRVLVVVYAATVPVFRKALSGAEYDCGADAAPLDGTADASRGSLSYQWYAGGDGGFAPIRGADGPVFTPPTGEGGTRRYRVEVTNRVGTSAQTAVSAEAAVTVYVAEKPVFLRALEGAQYDLDDPAAALDGTARVERGSLAYQWFLDGAAMEGETGAVFTPPSGAPGVFRYRVEATCAVGTSRAAAVSAEAEITVYTAQAPVFTRQPESAGYTEHEAARPLACAADSPRGSVALQWQAWDGAAFRDIEGAVGDTAT